MPDVDFGERVASPLRGSRPTTRDSALTEAQETLSAMASDIEGRFSRSGFYDASAAPFAPPSTPHDAPWPATRPQVKAVRGLWLGRWNPSDGRWYDRRKKKNWSDIADAGLFPWGHPEMAVRDGWWISTERWSDRRLHARLGDIVVVQRQRPISAHRRVGVPLDLDRMLVGLASIVAKVAWLDAISGRYDTQACLAPLCRFDFEVPRDIVKNKGRLTSPAFTDMPAQADGTGMNRQISAVPDDAAVDLLSICGVSPEVLSEPDLAKLAARLAATSTGNREYLELRYDHQVRQAARKANEDRAEDAAIEWAKDSGYTFVSRDAWHPLLGYDLLFRDGQGQKLQVEVKGYSTNRLSNVRLQPSQVRRATEAAAGTPPDWRLYALLRAASTKPVEVVRLPHEVVTLVASGGIKVA